MRKSLIVPVAILTLPACAYLYLLKPFTISGYYEAIGQGGSHRTDIVHITTDRFNVIKDAAIANPEEIHLADSDDPDYDLMMTVKSRGDIAYFNKGILTHTWRAKSEEGTLIAIKNPIRLVQLHIKAWTSN